MLRVSNNKRFLVRVSNEKPFFWLGDTAWELFHRLNREEATHYLENRRQNGFNVIQAVVLAELDGLRTPNPYGEIPLHNTNPTTPNDAYFEHVDWIINLAEDKGIYLGMLPTWGSYVVNGIINVDNAYDYGQYLGKRYQAKTNIIWILGGDRAANGYEMVWRQLARGLTAGDGGKFLKTFHPQGGGTSAIPFHNEVWLDFNMLQSGHRCRDLANYEAISADYNRTPTKPCLDGEPRYEDIWVGFNPLAGYFRDYDIRQAAYWAVFAGAFGHTYGNNAVWMMQKPSGPHLYGVERPWYDALDRPGATQLIHLKNLMLSRPFLSGVPDQSLIKGDLGVGANHLRAISGDGYAFVYAPTGQRFEVNLGQISASTVRAYWYDPRNGTHHPIGDFPDSGTRVFEPPNKPNRGNDWVLVLDDLFQKFPPPGTV